MPCSTTSAGASSRKLRLCQLLVHRIVQIDIRGPIFVLRDVEGPRDGGLHDDGRAQAPVRARGERPAASRVQYQLAVGAKLKLAHRQPSLSDSGGAKSVHGRPVDAKASRRGDPIRVARGRPLHRAELVPRVSTSIRIAERFRSAERRRGRLVVLLEIHSSRRVRIGAPDTSATSDSPNPGSYMRYIRYVALSYERGRRLHV
mmetsp:Transcript_10044/g.27307  ORF Transcript_10044/g.27307 Transcript_10044/m.27307 type:complete len:202 (-) Transcript_10044:48-653(-)